MFLQFFLLGVREKLEDLFGNVGIFIILGQYKARRRRQDAQYAGFDDSGLRYHQKNLEN